MSLVFTSSQSGLPEVETNSGPSLASRRAHSRFSFLQRADWDFFSDATGRKPGFFENISERGCLLRTDEPIEHRRWIRILVREGKSHCFFTAVGRVIRREDRIEAWSDEQGSDTVTLHRYGIEFVHPLNPYVLERIREDATPCAECARGSASIPDVSRPGAFLCVLCHLRRACHNLLVSQES